MRKVRNIDDALRLQIIEEHLSGSSKYSLARKYKFRHSSLINSWMRTFGITEPVKEEYPEVLMKKSKQDANKSAEVLALEQEIKALRTRLAYSEMKAAAYDTMIDLAEEIYQIKVRKNSATKQS
jgi:transposase-like protein